MTDYELQRAMTLVAWSALTTILAVWALGEWGVLVVLVALLVGVLWVCTKIGARRERNVTLGVVVLLLVMHVSIARADTASWYGDEGGPVACGPGRIPPGSIHVAHKTLPCGTRVVVELRGRRVRGRVTDRGPYVPGREWDLSREMMRRLGGLDAGVVEVRVRVQRVKRCTPAWVGRAYSGVPRC